MLKSNYDKLNFSRGMTGMEGGFITSDACHNYGIMSGCDEGCPALLAGDCPNVIEALEMCNFFAEERAEILTMYKVID